MNQPQYPHPQSRPGQPYDPRQQQPYGYTSGYQPAPPPYPQQASQPIFIPQQRGNPEPPPKKDRKKWPWVAAVAVLALVVIAVGVSEKSPSSPVSAVPTSAPRAAAAAPTATPTPTPTTTTAPPVSPPTVQEGRGDDVVTIQKDSGPAILKFECPKCTSNTVVKSDGYDSLLVNEIGSYSGRHLIDAYDNSATSTIEIKATGSWKLTVSSGIGSATRYTGAPVSGKGDDVVLVNSETTKARITNKGESNFVVKTYSSAGGADLAVNTIGSYNGTVPLSGPAMVTVMSSGSWTIDPS